MGTLKQIQLMFQPYGLNTRSHRASMTHWGLSYKPYSGRTGKKILRYYLKSLFIIPIQGSILLYCLPGDTHVLCYIRPVLYFLHLWVLEGLSEANFIIRGCMRGPVWISVYLVDCWTSPQGNYATRAPIVLENQNWHFDVDDDPCLCMERFSHLCELP